MKIDHVRGVVTELLSHEFWNSNGMLARMPDTTMGLSSRAEQLQFTSCQHISVGSNKNNSLEFMDEHSIQLLARTTFNILRNQKEKQIQQCLR